MISVGRFVCVVLVSKVKLKFMFLSEDGPAFLSCTFFNRVKSTLFCIFSRVSMILCRRGRGKLYLLCCLGIKRL